MNIKQYIKHCQKRVNKTLNQLLPRAHKEPQELHRAMRYAVLNGGKRIRSALVYATGEALGARPDVLDHVSAAIEMVHAFSLIHDDLPALDNDDLRRGKPTCHKAFSEAIAILAGDALQTLAFETLTCIDSKKMPAPLLLKMLNQFAHAIGPSGLAGGQALDIGMENKNVTLKKLALTYQLKTGNFITTSILMGALAAHCEKKKTLQALQYFGNAIGLAFQIHDDIIGIEKSTQQLGKTQNSDASRNKPTYPSLMGMAKAKQAATRAFTQALDYLHKIPVDTSRLAAIAEYIVEREY